MNSENVDKFQFVSDRPRHFTFGKFVGGEESFLCFDFDGDSGLEVDGEVVFEYRNLRDQALALGIAFLKERFGVTEIYTGVVHGNAAAKHLYGSVGFVPTGLYEFGMEELRLEC